MHFRFGTRKDINNYDIAEDYNGVVLMLRVVYNAKSIAVLKAMFDKNRVLLADIDIPRRYVNQGIGSKLIERFEDICKKKGITEICGNLSDSDVDHKDRLLHFYKKHGYEIDYVDDGKRFSGKIYKKLA